MKKQLYRAALLAALGLGGATAAQAQSDMLLGFNDAGANTATAAYQNDYVIDMGALSQFTASSTYSTTINQSTFDSAFVTPDTSWANEVAVGVVGEDNSVSPHLIYVSGASTPGAISSPRLGNIITDASGIASGEYTMLAGGAAQTGWSYLVGVQPGNAGILNGNPLGTGNEVAAQGTSPLSYLVNGQATFNLYQATSAGSTHAFTELGTFTINANDGVDTINYNGISAAVPEPGTYGLLAGAGLLALALRRQFSAKIA